MSSNRSAGAVPWLCSVSIWVMAPISASQLCAADALQLTHALDLLDPPAQAAIAALDQFQTRSRRLPGPSQSSCSC